MSRDIHMPLAIDDIDVLEGRREVVAATVKRLADSIEQIGMRHPITVRRKGDRYSLVAGRHRLEACKKLGREHVPAVIVSMTNAEARKWEIAENLHRAELTKLERDEQIAEWIRLTDEEKPAQLAPVSGGRGNEGGINAASRELGIERTEAQRAVKVASITDEAKDAAREAGLDNNRSALLQVAKEAPERQVAKVIEIAQPLNELESKAKQVAALMSAWNRAGTEAREEFLSMVERPLMDQRFGA